MRIHDFTKRSVLIPLCCMVFLLGYLGVALSMGPLLLDSGLTNENFILSSSRPGESCSVQASCGMN
jgi:hypothetical protein